MSEQEMIIEVECTLDACGIKATTEQIEFIAKGIQAGIENHGMGAPDYPKTILENEHNKLISYKDSDIKQIEKEYEERIRGLKWHISDLESTISDLQGRLRNA